ncbi:Uncharacterised protein [Mycobacterium tuberculosis]|nr:Uncharacterised protein [Mycobacterium tuberculosis]
MAAKATHPTTPSATAEADAASPVSRDVAAPAPADVASCPVCGGPVPDRTGLPGRRVAWCSKACRQAAWRARRAATQAAEAARQVAEQVPAARRDLANIGGALQAALDRMPDAAVRPGASGGRDADTDVAAPVSGWESDIAGWARRLAAAATRLAELADAHTSHVADHRRAAAVIRRPPASRDRDDESPVAPPAGIVATTAAEASETNHPAAPAAPAAAAIDTDDLFDAVEDVLDVRDVPGIPQDVLQDAADVPAGLVGTSFADALDALAAVHQAATGDGPVDDLAAAAAAVVRARPPYLPARADAAVTRLQEVITGT